MRIMKREGIKEEGTEEKQNSGDKIEEEGRYFTIPASLREGAVMPSKRDILEDKGEFLP